VGRRFFAPVQTGPGAHPVFCTMGTGPFLGVKSGRGVTLTPHPLLVPWSRNSRVILLLPLWAVRPVQRLSACTMVHFMPYKTRITSSSDFIRSLFTSFLLGQSVLLSTLFSSRLNLCPFPKVTTKKLYDCCQQCMFTEVRNPTDCLLNLLRQSARLCNSSN